MANLFGSNHSEVGSLSENLILNTAGKIKIRYGSKFIDLLDNQGNINSGTKTITSVNSEDSMSSDGLYYLNGSIYYKVNSDKGMLSNNFSVSFDTEQSATEEQINTAQKNIGITFKTDEEATAIITNGVVIVNNQIKVINDGEIQNYLSDSLTEINKLDESEESDIPTTFVKINNIWRYMQVAPYKESEIFPVTWKYSTQQNGEILTKVTFVSSGNTAAIPLEIIKNEYALSNCSYSGSQITQPTTITCYE